MANLNKVFLIGNLTKDPELRYTPGGSPVVDLDLATSRTYVTKTGEKKEEVCFVRIVAWGRQAETCGEYLSKGSPIFAEGRLHLDSWETQEGEKRSRLKVHAQRIQFLGKTKKTSDEKKTTNQESTNDFASSSSEEMVDDIPF
ncbi:single-stranded DNA-binding protein [Candidatus Auribacterota bacterium]